LISPVAAKDLSDEQKTELARIKSLVDRGGKYYKSGDFEKSADRIREAQKRLIKLAGTKNAEVVAMLKSDYARIETAQTLLKKQNEKFDELPDLNSFMPSESGSNNVDNPNDEQNPFESDAVSTDKDVDSDADSKEMDPDHAKDAEADNPELVSFTKEVAPIIVEHCGKCHIRETKGTYSAATYDSLKKGTKKKGVAVKPGDVEKSRMVSLIEGGEMPPKSKGFPAEELATLKSWIEQGAKFDGKNKKQTLLEIVGDESPADDRGGGSPGRRDRGPRRGG
jgi:mono/diheme cytochrome c family protein